MRQSPGASAPGLCLLLRYRSSGGTQSAALRQRPTSEDDPHRSYDHRKLGRELEIFDTDPLIGAGLPYWLPAGAAIRHALEEYVRELERRAGYQHVYSPVLGKRELYELSGHWQHYRDGMYPPMDLGRRAGRAAAEHVPAPCGDVPVAGAQLP